MPKEIMNQDALPNVEELERIAVEPLPLIVRVAIAYAVVVALGLGLLAG